MKAARRLLRAPLLHFLVLGALVHAALALRPETLELDAAHLAELDAQWWRETGRAPTAAERDAMRRRAADEEMLVREALRLELDASDPVVRARLLRNIALIAPEETIDEDRALARARRLDMAARDVLARRRLLQIMEARLSSLPGALSPGELDAHVAGHPERYGLAARSSFEHVFLGDDPDGSRAVRAFPAGNRFASMPDARVASLFGPVFAATVASAPIGEWVPTTSAFGAHRVRVSAREPARGGSAQAAGSAAIWGAIEARERRQLQQALDRLRGRYRIVVGERA